MTFELFVSHILAFSKHANIIPGRIAIILSILVIVISRILLENSVGDINFILWNG